MSARRATIFVACLGLLAGCGHAVEPRAPYDAPEGVPVPRATNARYLPGVGLVVTWSATPADRIAIEGWSVERRTTTETAFTALTAVPIRDTTIVDGDLADGVRAVYRVFSVTAAGVRSLPAETAPERADLVPPTVPTDVVATTAPGGVEVTFTPGPDSDLAYFEVRLIETGTSNPPLFRAVPGSPASIGGLVGGATYAIEVAAVDSAGRLSGLSAPPATAVAGP